MKQGYIYLFRSIQENELYFSEPFTRMQAWIDILLQATHKPTLRYIRGVPVKIGPGELIVSYRYLQSRWGWSNNKIKNFLKMLEKATQITTQKNNVSTIIKVNNWEKYQQSSGKSDAIGNAEATQKRRKQECKECKECK